MNTPTSALVAAVVAYLVGSLPFGYLIARLKGIDIRAQGSGNIGATNVARTLGIKWGILVFVLDAIKGFLPVWLLPLILLGPDSPLRMHFEVLVGIATVLGHIFPVWLKFRGGKGVATSAGVVLMISTTATLVAVLVYGVMLAWKRIGSLASLMAAAAFSVAHFLLLILQGTSPFETAELSRSLFTIVMPIVIIVCHKKNLVRLLRGEEPKFGQSREKNTSANGQRPGSEQSTRRNESGRKDEVREGQGSA